MGATFSPAGKVLLVPLGDSIEFWNAAQGALLGRLMTPEELQGPILKSRYRRWSRWIPVARQFTLYPLPA